MQRVFDEDSSRNTFDTQYFFTPEELTHLHTRILLGVQNELERQFSERMKNLQIQMSQQLREVIATAHIDLGTESQVQFVPVPEMSFSACELVTYAPQALRKQLEKVQLSTLESLRKTGICIHPQSFDSYDRERIKTIPIMDITQRQIGSLVRVKHLMKWIIVQ